MNKRETREALIEAGLELIRSSGYSATGINQILDAADTRSFYSHFASKDQFVIEVVGFYVAGERQRMERILGDSNFTPLAKMRRYFEEMIAAYGLAGGPIAGCLLGNLSLEVSVRNETIRKHLRSAFEDWQKTIAGTIQEAIDRGELPPSIKAPTLAAIIMDSWQGAQVRAKAEQSDKALHLFFDNAFSVLLKGEGY